MNEEYIIEAPLPMMDGREFTEYCLGLVSLIEKLQEHCIYSDNVRDTLKMEIDMHHHFIKGEYEKNLSERKKLEAVNNIKVIKGKGI